MSRPPDRLTQFWLAERLRRQEERDGLADPVLPEACQSLTEGPARLLCRAGQLAREQGWERECAAWRTHAQVVLGGMALIALLVGLGSARTVLGDGSRPVNLVWAWLGLLGMHGLGLAAWLAGTFWPGRPGSAGGGWLGQAAFQVARRLERSTAARDSGAALAAVLARSRLGQHALSALTHALWALMLAAATAGLTGLLLVQKHDFRWESTLLPAHTLGRWVERSGALPAAIGFEVPDAAAVAASRNADTNDDDTRRRWSAWLLGSVLVYGVLPRLLCLVGCLIAARRALARLSLPLDLPPYPALQAALAPDRRPLGVRDPAPPSLPAPSACLPPVAGQPGGGVRVVALELDPALLWPPALPAGSEDGGRLDDPAGGRACVQALQARPTALLVVFDPQRTPDRGSLHLLAALAGAAPAWALASCGLFYPDDAAAGARRLAQWREALARLDPAAPLLSERAALDAWLKGPA